MNILHITRACGTDPRYGIHKSLLPIVRVLRGKGHDVEVLDLDQARLIALKPWESLLVKSYCAWMRTRLGGEGLAALHFLRERVEVGIRAAKIAAQRNVTHVHCHDPLLGYMYDIFRTIYHSAATWGISEHAYGRFVKLRLGVETSERALKILQKQELKATKKAGWVLFPTKSGMDQFLVDMQLKGPLSSFHVIPHAIDIQLIDRTAARGKLAIKKNELLLIAAGGLIPMKRFDQLLRALALLPRSIMPRIIILGEGPEEQALIKQAVALNLADHFTITATDHIGEYLSAADVYVSTSATESFGMASCEALVAGVPSVLTAVDAVPGLVGDAALLVHDNPQEISAAIQSILTSEAVRLQLKAKAAARTALWQGPEVIADRMIEIYEKAC